MSYSKVYSRINWQNEPSTNTPINETNLNAMDYALNEVDNRIITIDTSKANQSDLLQSLKSLTYDPTTGVFVFTYWNGTTETVDLNIEKIPVSFSMDANGIITMTTSDGSTYTADVGSLIKTYTFSDSTDIDFTTTTDASGNKTVTAEIVDGSVTASKLQPNYLADIQTEVANAQGYANSASGSATTAGNQALEAEAWADGQKNGVDVPSTAEQYHNNAKYWAEQAQQAGGGGVTSFNNRTGAVVPASGDYTASMVGAVASNGGDTEDCVATFTSSDVADGQATSWTSVTPMATGETHFSLFGKLSQIAKNVRYLYKMIGTTDLSAIADGTVTKAISDAYTTEKITATATNLSSGGLTFTLVGKRLLIVTCSGLVPTNTSIPIVITLPNSITIDTSKNQSLYLMQYNAFNPSGEVHSIVPTGSISAHSLSLAVNTSYPYMQVLGVLPVTAI